MSSILMMGGQKIQEISQKLDGEHLEKVKIEGKERTEIMWIKIGLIQEKADYHEREDNNMSGELNRNGFDLIWFNMVLNGSRASKSFDALWRIKGRHPLIDASYWIKWLNEFDFFEWRLVEMGVKAEIFEEMRRKEKDWRCFWIEK